MQKEAYQMHTGAIVVLLLIWAIFWAVRTKLTFSKVAKNVWFYVSLAAAIFFPIGISLAASMLFEVPQTASALFGIFTVAVAAGLIWRAVISARQNHLYALQKHNIFTIGFILSIALPVIYLLTPCFFNTVELAIEAINELPHIFADAAKTLEFLKEAFEDQSAMNTLSSMLAENQGMTNEAFIATGEQLFGNDLFDRLNTIYRSTDTTLIEAFRAAGDNLGDLQASVYSLVVRTAVVTGITTFAPLGMLFAGLVSAVLPGSLFASVGRILHPNDDSDWPAKIVLVDIIYLFIIRLAWAVSPYTINTTIDNFNAVFSKYFRAHFGTTLHLPSSVDGWTFYSNGSALSFVLLAFLLISTGACLLYLLSRKRNEGFFIGGAATSFALPVLLLATKSAILPFNLLGLAAVIFPGMFLYLFGYIYRNDEMKKWKKKLLTLCICSAVYLIALTLLLLFFG